MLEINAFHGVRDGVGGLLENPELPQANHDS